VFLGDRRVEGEKERDDKRWGKASCEMGTWSILCASQLIFPDMASTSPDAACNYTDMRSSQYNQRCCTPDFSFPLVFLTLFLSSSHITLFLVHNSTIIAEQKVKSSLCISPCHDHHLTPSTVYTTHNIHQPQHTLSTIYTEYSIYQVQYTPNTAYTECSIQP